MGAPVRICYLGDGMTGRLLESPPLPVLFGDGSFLVVLPVADRGAGFLWRVWVDGLQGGSRLSLCLVRFPFCTLIDP